MFSATWEYVTTLAWQVLVAAVVMFAAGYFAAPLIRMMGDF
jgi:hypothetical protein